MVGFIDFIFIFVIFIIVIYGYKLGMVLEIVVWVNVKLIRRVGMDNLMLCFKHR